MYYIYYMYNKYPLKMATEISNEAKQKYHFLWLKIKLKLK